MTKIRTIAIAAAAVTAAALPATPAAARGGADDNPTVHARTCSHERHREAEPRHEAHHRHRHGGGAATSCRRSATA